MTDKDVDPSTRRSLSQAVAETLARGALNGVEARIVSDQKHGPRKPRLENGEVRPRSGGVYTTPDKDAITAVVQEGGGRITYFPAQEAQLQNGIVSDGEPAFYKAIFEPLCDEIRGRYPDRKLALRAITTSINGSLEGALGTVEHGDIADITDTINKGVEKDVASFNVQHMDMTGDSRGAAMGLKYISRYTYAVGMDADFMDNPDHGAAAFPAVLVYDATMLEQTGEDRFTETFRNGVDPQVALLQAYVLDRPSR